MQYKRSFLFVAKYTSELTGHKSIEMIWNDLSPSESIGRAPGALLNRSRAHVRFQVVMYLQYCISAFIGPIFLHWFLPPKFDIPPMLLFGFFSFVPSTWSQLRKLLAVKMTD